MRKVKVLHILNELLPSGAEAMLYSAAPDWRCEGIEGEILATGSQVGSFAEQLERAGYRIHHIPNPKSFGFIWRFFRLLRLNRYDVVHIHTERMNLLYAVMAWLLGIPRIVRTIHGLFAFRRLLRVRRIIGRFVSRALLGVVTVSISPSAKRVEWDNFRNPSQVIPNWFDSRRFRPPTPGERERARQQMDIPCDSLVVATVGACLPGKNHAAVIEALHHLNRRLPLCYLHVGAGVNEAAEHNLCDALGVSDQIRFLGMQNDVLPALRAADLFIMPSLFEGFGVAAVEAMGAQVPVLLADVDGLRDFRQVSSEIRWSAPTPDSIAEAIEHFAVLSEAERRSIADQVSRAALDWFGVNRGATAYARVYRDEPGGVLKCRGQESTLELESPAPYCSTNSANICGTTSR